MNPEDVVPKGYYRHRNGLTVWLLGLALDPDGQQWAVWHQAQGAREGDLRVWLSVDFFACHTHVYPEKDGEE